MRTARSWIFLVALLSQGCSLALEGADIEPTDLSSVVVGGADRAVVEKALGNPISGRDDDPARIATYCYDTGGQGHLDGEHVKSHLGLYGMIFEPILTPLALLKRRKRVEWQEREIRVAYDEDGLVTAVEMDVEVEDACD